MRKNSTKNLPMIIVVIILAIFAAGAIHSAMKETRRDDALAQSVIEMTEPLAGGSATDEPESAKDESTNTAPSAQTEQTSTESLSDWMDFRVGPAVTDQPYDRKSQFGSWADTDGNGCDARNDILNRDMTDVKQGKVSGCPFGVLSGTLSDPYTGKTIEFTRGAQTSAAVQVDHMIPLKYAWEHGAWEWTQEQRVQYANDPDVLIASDGPANMAKGAKGPADWMPENVAYQCDYAKHWVKVAKKYDLTISAEDTEAIYYTLQEHCGMN